MDTPLQSDPQQQAAIDLQTSQQENLFDFQKAKVQIDLVISSWSMDVREAEARRKERYVELDIETMRQVGDLEEDETFIPDRVIDGNIKREKSNVMAFLNAGNRLAIFDCLSDPTIDTRTLEQEFTQGLTFKGWYREFERTVDGAALHGMDYIEVVFDDTKPLHVGFEHVGFDKLYYNRKVEDIQDSEYLIRKYELTISKLEEFKLKKGFDPDQIDNVIKNYENRKRNDTVEVFKVYVKYQGIVYVSWYCTKTGATDWLNPPTELRLGIWEKDINGKDTPSSLGHYPIYTNIYCDDEQFAIIDKKGRGFLDSPQQEANTAILTAFVNGSVRSSFVYASPKDDDSDSSEMKQLDVQLQPNCIYNKPLNWFSKPAPDVTMLTALQVIDTKNAVQSGQTAYAANNRKDSRKTAEELKQASDTEQKITSTGLAGFSEFLRDVLQFAWQIVKSQALQNKIKFLLIPGPANPNMPGPQTFINNTQIINQEYDIRPAGDTDVVEAQQLQQMMMQDWPVVQNTAMKDQFLMDYVKVRYPKKANEYVALLAQNQMMQQLQQKVQQASVLVPALNAALTGALNPAEIKALKPDEQHQLEQLQQQATAFAPVPVKK